MKSSTWIVFSFNLELFNNFNASLLKNKVMGHFLSHEWMSIPYNLITLRPLSTKLKTELKAVHIFVKVIIEHILPTKNRPDEIHNLLIWKSIKVISFMSVEHLIFFLQTYSKNIQIHLKDMHVYFEQLVLCLHLTIPLCI